MPIVIILTLCYIQLYYIVLHGADTLVFVLYNTVHLNNNNIIINIYPLRKTNESVVTVLSLMKVTTRKKCWKERENWQKLAAEPRTTYALMQGFSSSSQPTAGTIRPFSPYRLVPKDGMVQLTFAGVKFESRRKPPNGRIGANMLGMQT